MKIPILKISKFRFKLKVIDQLNVPEYKGSMIRGAFGATFRSVSCAINEKTCDNCILKSQCIYFKIFETELPNLNYQYLKGVKKVPHPFVLHPPLNDSKTYKVGEFFEIGLTLFGNTAIFFPYFIYTIKKMGENGIGKGRGHFEISEISSVTFLNEETAIPLNKPDDLNNYLVPFNSGKLLDSVNTSANSITLSFLTPFRFQIDGDVIKSKNKLDLTKFMMTIVRRYFSLLAILENIQLPDDLYVDIYNNVSSGSVKITRNNLWFYDWERYSSRQDKRFSLGGFLGNITLEGDLSQMLPFLLLGSLINIGKNSVFGLGQYNYLINNQNKEVENV